MKNLKNNLVENPYSIILSVCSQIVPSVSRTTRVATTTRNVDIWRRRRLAWKFSVMRRRARTSLAVAKYRRKFPGEIHYPTCIIYAAEAEETPLCCHTGPETISGCSKTPHKNSSSQGISILKTYQTYNSSSSTYLEMLSQGDFALLTLHTYFFISLSKKSDLPQGWPH